MFRVGFGGFLVSILSLALAASALAQQVEIPLATMYVEAPAELDPATQTKRFRVAQIAPDDGRGDPVFIMRKIDFRVNPFAVLLDYEQQNLTYFHDTDLYLRFYDSSRKFLFERPIRRISVCQRDTFPRKFTERMEDGKFPEIAFGAIVLHIKEKEPIGDRCG